MSMRILFAAFICLLVTGGGSQLMGQLVSPTPTFGGGMKQVTATLVPEVSAAAPGEAFRLAVQLDHQKHWHTYGKVLPEGVVGKPTKLTFTAPEGWTIEELPWPPTTEVASTGGAMSEGYEGTVYLPARVTPPADATVGSEVTLAVKVDALVCDPQSCLPIKPEATLVISIAAKSVPNPAAADVFLSVAGGGSATEPVSGVEPVETAAPVPATSFLGYLLFAFIGGLILNVMPCVFPVLGIKVMGVVQQAGGEKKHIIAHSLAYTAGVLLSFWILGGVVVALGKAWGFQLQIPGFNYALAVFFLVFGLNMAGVFEIGASVIGVGAELQSSHGTRGSFFSGFLATVVATPCSAPILGSALGATLALPPFQAMMIFTLIGLGLASPFLVLALIPKLVSALPRPGAWMESFKQGMSFLLFGTVAYFCWVLTGMIEGQALLFMLLSLVLVAVGCWVYGRWALPHKPVRTRWVAVVVSLVFALGGIVYGWPHREEASPVGSGGTVIEGGLEWVAWSPEKEQELRSSKTPIYIDFTAKWCFTCQVNKRVYKDDTLQKLIEDKQVVLLRADWTNEDQRITDALAELGKAAVPVNVLYLPGKEEPLVLPELLTVENVSEALRQAGE